MTTENKTSSNEDKDTSRSQIVIPEDKFLNASVTMGAWLRVNPNATARNAVAEYIRLIESISITQDRSLSSPTPAESAMAAANEIVAYITSSDNAEPDDSNGSPTEYIAGIISRHQPTDEVEAALKELREMPELAAWTLSVAQDRRAKHFTITIWPTNGELSEREIDGATLVEAMACVRQWAAEQSKE